MLPDEVMPCHLITDSDNAPPIHSLTGPPHDFKRECFTLLLLSPSYASLLTPPPLVSGPNNIFILLFIIPVSISSCSSTLQGLGLLW
mmetsp:Transcript_56090/g.82043  ORF Transcript_56090/g.82043 Transcript_56090/m.82043 type:complete len:87 (+) Transcript_56090:72-332(+)